MTIVCYRDGVLAADKKSTYNGSGVTTTKIRRLGDGCIAGAAGSGGMCRELMAWYEDGATPDKYPDKTALSLMMVITPDRGVMLYDASPYPLLIEDPFFAIGSGKDAAMAAMHMGADPREAVRIACLVDDGCGRGIDVLELHAS